MSISRTPGRAPLTAHVFLTKIKVLPRPVIKFELQGTWRETRSYSAMQRDIELIFPIKDAASAALMTIKADCLHKAGIINEAEKQHVHSRARTFLDDGPLKDAA